MSKKAAIIKREERVTPKNYPGTLGDVVSYYLDPPLLSDGEEHTYVLVSQAAPLGEWGTFIFPASADGALTDWGELDGSRRGFITPDDLMREIGYEVIG